MGIGLCACTSAVIVAPSVVISPYSSACGSSTSDTLGSLQTACRHVRTSSGLDSTAVVVSMGLSMAAYDGSAARSRAVVCGVNSASFSPALPTMSAHNAAVPPEPE
ncbi:hypothetical protein D3C81_1183800 [compost metagenome]